MKSLLLAIFVLTSLLGNAQSNSETDSTTNQTIYIEIITEKDTLEWDSPFPVFIQISNNSDNDIFIPEMIDFVSSLYPNGINEVWEGAVVKLNIEPISMASPFTIENNVVVKSTAFINLKANSTKRFPLTDLAKYLREYNSDIECEELKLPLKEENTLQVSYTNWRKNVDHPTFIGTVHSNSKTIFIEKSAH